MLACQSYFVIEKGLLGLPGTGIGLLAFGGGTAWEFTAPFGNPFCGAVAAAAGAVLMVAVHPNPVR